MEESEKRLVEYIVEAVIIAWLGYLFLYQNYLLYRWHRGLPLPDRWPFLMVSFGVALLFLAYEVGKLERETPPEASERPIAVEGREEGNPFMEREGAEIKSSTQESPQEP